MLSALVADALAKIHQVELADFQFSESEGRNRQARIEELLKNLTSHLEDKQKARINHEFFGLGPLQDLLIRIEITEIIVNGPRHILYEEKGTLREHEDSFLSETTFKNAMDRLQELCHISVNKEYPFADGSWGPFRVSIVDESISEKGFQVTLRRHPDNPWSFQKLLAQSWASESQVQFLKDLLLKRKNILVVGSTGSGKTSLMNALLDETGPQCRNIIIEDASELKIPNVYSSKLLTRESAQKGIYSEINQADLVRRTLRLRPDRIIMGEIRGGEAKDFLMALATGHAGSFASIHAQDPQQALIRLEMLVQMGAPQWSLQAIRRLIQLSLDYVVVVRKNPEGQRALQGIFRLSSLEHHGFLLESEAP